MTANFREEVITTDAGLVGILTRPVAGVDVSRPAMVILNSGNMHRVGTGRVSVTLARRLAGQGHLVLRFDHAAVGDSAPRRDALDLEESRQTEIKEMLTLLCNRFGTVGFVLYGLCSGARDAYNVALTDERVTGLVMIDGFSYPNFRFHVNAFAKRISKPAAVFRSLLRRIGLRPALQEATSGEDFWVQDWPDYPPQEVIARGYQTLVDRSVALFVVYTGGWADTYNYERQFLDINRTVDFRDQLTLLYLPEAEHTLTNPRFRRLVLDRVCDWMPPVIAPPRESRKQGTSGPSLVNA
jgi:pimeloyl-ACP methyl ester carboxylesterase